MELDPPVTTEDPEEGLWPVKEEDQDCTAPHRRGAALSLWQSRTRWPPSLEMSVVTSQVNTERVHLNQRESFLSWTRRLHRPAPRGNMTFLIAACWRAPSGPAASSGHRCSCPPQRQAICVTQQNSGRQRRSLRISIPNNNSRYLGPICTGGGRAGREHKTQSSHRQHLS